MARASVGGITSSVILTVFIDGAAYLLVYGRKDRSEHSPELETA
jgi:Cu/Ag efflux pump CusA